MKSQKKTQHGAPTRVGPRSGNRPGAAVPLYTRSIPIHELNCEGIRLDEPVQVEIEHYREEVLAKIPELDLWASEATESEALLSIKTAICDLWNELKEEDESTLGKLPLMWKRILTRMIRGNATC